MLAISLKNLSKRYSGRQVVNGVSLSVGKGEIVGLLGPNGAGKTTTFYMVIGIVKPDQGQVFLGEWDITRLPMYQRSRHGIGYLAQEASVFRRLSVEDNVRLIWEMWKIPPAEQRARLPILLQEFGLSGVREQMAYTLSGGERRRVELARAMATNPSFLLLDEPFTGIDPIAIGELQAIIGTLKARGIGILITDHNVRETLRITDRSYIISDGEILVAGTSREIAEDPTARKYYLGEQFTL